MKKLLFSLSLLMPAIVFSQVQYPQSKKGNVMEDYHGTKVADP
jgi:hypothetical protein